MADTIDYYFTATSPWTYLGHRRFTDILARHGAAVNVKPVDYGRIFPISGGLPLKQRAAQRQAYRLVELKRFRDALNVPLNLHPKYFPVPAEAAALSIISADRKLGSEAAMRLTGAILAACWTQERDISDTETLSQIIAENGFDAASLRSDSEEAKRTYDAYTDEAIERQVFGAPTYVLRGELFWGQDRLEFLERALAR
jgi:carboxymethylenebutenolidase